MQEFQARFPRAKWIQWEPLGPHNAREGSRLAFGEYVDAQYAIEKADVIFSLDADFLCKGAAGLRHSRAFAARRRLEGDQTQLNRLYAVESDATNTGSRADHRLPLKASEIELLARTVASRLGVAGAGGDAAPLAAAHWIDPLVKDLQANRGRSLVIAGDGQPAIVHALAHAMNDTLGNVGATVVYTRTVEAQPMDQRAGLQTLVNDMKAGTVELLVILGGNPVYTAPADLQFADAMQKVAIRVHLGLYDDETAALAHWHICESHYLESWSDVRSDDGTVTIVQPLIAPLYDGKSAHEVMTALTGPGERSGYELVRALLEQPGRRGRHRHARIRAGIVALAVGCAGGRRRRGGRDRTHGDAGDGHAGGGCAIARRHRDVAVRSRLAQVAARRPRRRTRRSHRKRWPCRRTSRRRPRRAPRDRDSKWSSVRTPPSMTADSTTTRGCRKSRSR